MKIGNELKSLKRDDGTMKLVMTREYTPNNYRRVFLNQFVPLLNTYANKSTAILLYLLQTVDSNNLIYAPYSEIMEKCKVTDKKLLGSVMKELQEAEVLVRTSQSHYMLNPALMMQGNNQKFGLLANEFNSYTTKRKRNKENR